MDKRIVCEDVPFVPFTYEQLVYLRARLTLLPLYSARGRDATFVAGFKREDVAKLLEELKERSL